MFRNYLVTALRNLAHNSLYAGINIFGLAVGFATALLIAVVVWHEYSFEHFIPGYESVYRLSTELSTDTTDEVRGPIAEELRLAFPQIRDVASLRKDPGSGSVRRGDIESVEPGLYWADPEIFDVLPLPALAGDLKTALKTPDGLVLTRRMARKYFGNDLPLGQTIEIDREHTMRVMAVLEDLPSNTHLNTEIFASALGLPPVPKGEVFLCYVYLRLAPGTSADALRSALPPFFEKLERSRNNVIARTQRLSLIAIGDIHLHPAGRLAMKPAGDPRLLRAIAIVGLLVLMTAAINFICLMTARSAHRAVEVGVRKTVGGSRNDLIVQFVGESVIYSLIGMLCAIGLAYLLLPEVNGLLDRSIGIEYWHAPWLAWPFGLVLSVGILAGIYPALVLSAFRPATVLKGIGPHVGGSKSIRQSLVAVQFAILIGLFLATLVIKQQMTFGLRQGLRFDQDQLLWIHLPTGGCPDSAFAQRVRALPGVRSTACSMEFLFNYGTQQYRMPGGREVTLQNGFAGPGLFELLGLNPVAGRFFSPNLATDISPSDPRERDTHTLYHSVINETAARRMGFASPNAAIGQIFTALTGALPGMRREIVGVVPDVAHDSVRIAIDPVLYDDISGYFDQLNIRLSGDRVTETLQAIDRLWQQLSPLPAPIEHHFYDQYTEGLYGDLERQTTLFSAFAVIALSLAGLGLFGLASFTVEVRTHEIGVRKAMGASRADILGMLLWQFAKPVLWASLLAWPTAAYLMHRWLQGFAYHVDLDPMTFVNASALALAIALATVSGHVLLIARTRPASALRYE